MGEGTLLKDYDSGADNVEPPTGLVDVLTQDEARGQAVMII